MQVRVIAFAALRDALGEGFPLDLPDRATPADIRERLTRDHPRWKNLIEASRLARGVDFLEEDAPLADGDEVVLIPPVSGGTGIPEVHLGPEPLDGEALKRAAADPAAGAVTVFEGTVRSPSEGRDVLYLEYEAYAEMATAQMKRILAEARKEWPVTALYLHHRTGRVEVGEPSVVAVASAPHRPEAFAACRFLIERLKADVPIWKKEFFADGSVWVGAPGECAHDHEPGQAD